MAFPLTDLSDDILREIFSRMTRQQGKGLILTCQRFNTLITSSCFRWRAGLQIFLLNYSILLAEPKIFGNSFPLPFCSKTTHGSPSNSHKSTSTGSSSSIPTDMPPTCSSMNDRLIDLHIDSLIPISGEPTMLNLKEIGAKPGEVGYIEKLIAPHETLRGFFAEAYKVYLEDDTVTLGHLRKFIPTKAYKIIIVKQSGKEMIYDHHDNHKTLASLGIDSKQWVALKDFAKSEYIWNT